MQVDEFDAQVRTFFLLLVISFYIYTVRVDVEIYNQLSCSDVSYIQVLLDNPKKLSI